MTSEVGTFATVGFGAGVLGKPTFALRLRYFGPVARPGTFRSVGLPATAVGKPTVALRLPAQRFAA